MTTIIQRFDHRDQYRRLRSEILRAIEDVLESDCLILGPKVRAFEWAMCRFLGEGGHGIGVGSGTDALAVALRALGIGPGDEVITVANTAIATVAAIRMVGATPVFCEIDPDTLMMDPNEVERCITPKTKSILPVHLFGNAVDMEAVTRIAARHGLKITEDCAQSCGTLFRGRPTGTWGDVGCFSFYPTKNLGACGDGGLCYTRDRDLAETMRQIRSYGCGSGPNALREGINSRLDELQAAILEIKLRELPNSAARRRLVAEAYLNGLSPRCRRVGTTPGTQHSYCLFVVLLENREPVIAHLRKAGIECGIHYPMPIHLMSAYEFLGYRAGSLAITERAATQVLSLPCYPGMSAQAVEKVIAAMNEATASG